MNFGSYKLVFFCLFFLIFTPFYLIFSQGSLNDSAKTDSTITIVIVPKVNYFFSTETNSVTKAFLLQFGENLLSELESKMLNLIDKKEREYIKLLNRGQVTQILEKIDKEKLLNQDTLINQIKFSSAKPNAILICELANSQIKNRTRISFKSTITHIINSQIIANSEVPFNTEDLLTLKERERVLEETAKKLLDQLKKPERNWTLWSIAGGAVVTGVVWILLQDSGGEQEEPTIPRPPARPD